MDFYTLKTYWQIRYGYLTWMKIEFKFHWFWTESWELMKKLPSAIACSVLLQEHNVRSHRNVQWNKIYYKNTRCCRESVKWNISRLCKYVEKTMPRSAVHNKSWHDVDGTEEGWKEKSIEARKYIQRCDWQSPQIVIKSVERVREKDDDDVIFIKSINEWEKRHHRLHGGDMVQSSTLLSFPWWRRRPKHQQLKVFVIDDCGRTLGQQ